MGSKTRPEGWDGAHEPGQVRTEFQAVGTARTGPGGRTHSAVWGNWKAVWVVG